jgi:uncharacterized protein (DUF433 family)
MRICVVGVVDLFASGICNVQIMEELPDLGKEDIEAAINYAHGIIDHPVVAA